MCSFKPMPIAIVAFPVRVGGARLSLSQLRRLAGLLRWFRYDGVNVRRRWWGFLIVFAGRLYVEIFEDGNPTSPFGALR
jgi:hypothetical protein